MRSRVVHLTSVHQPLDVRIQKQCAALADAGYEVTLVATAKGPAGGSRVPVRLLPRPTSRPRRMLVTTRQVQVAARELDADVYHFHDPELMFAGAALRRAGKRVVYDVHEDYAGEMLSKEWIASPLRPLVGRATGFVEQFFSRRFDLVVTATPTIARLFPPQKTVVVQNYPAREELVSREARPFSDREAAVAYVGDLTTGRGAREMVEAIGLVNPALAARLYIAGPVSTQHLDRDLEALPGFARTTMLGWIGRDEVRNLLARVRAGLVLFHPLPNHLRAQPNKLFEYMAAGIPVIGSDFPLWRELVGATAAGVLVDPMDTQAIAAAITRVLTNPADAEAMGRNGRAAVESEYNWENQAARLVEAYRALTS